MSLRAFETPWTDVAAHLSSGPGLAFLPFGALEQHGPHLPLGTDTVTAVHVASALADRFDGVLLPPIHYGDTWNNAGYPGTLSLSPATVTAIAVDLGRALEASGARGFVVVNGDWGNRVPLHAAMRILAEEGVIAAILLNYPGMDDAIAELRESAAAAPGLNHADEIETSIMLALRPETVLAERYTASYPELPADFGIRPMQLHPFSDSGVFGDPTTATAAKGAAILERTVAASVTAVDAFVAALPEREPRATT